MRDNNDDDDNKFFKSCGTSLDSRTPKRNENCDPF